MDDVARSGAKDLANTDFLGPSLCRERSQAEEAETANDHREKRKCRENLCTGHVCLIQSTYNVLAEFRLEWDVGGNLFPFLFHGSLHGFGIAVVANDHPSRSLIDLAEHQRLQFVAGRTELRVAHHANYGDRGLACFVREKSSAESLAEGILRRFESETLDSKLVQHGINPPNCECTFHRRIARIGRGDIVSGTVGIEPAAGEQLEPHGVEKARVHRIIANVDRLGRSGRYDAVGDIVVGRDT